LLSAEKSRIIALSARGMSDRDLAREVGRSLGTVQPVIREGGGVASKISWDPSTAAPASSVRKQAPGMFDAVGRFGRRQGDGDLVVVAVDHPPCASSHGGHVELLGLIPCCCRHVRNGVQFDVSIAARPRISTPRCVSPRNQEREGTNRKHEDGDGR